ncbi:acyl-CoA synthetase [Pseudoroseicyclus tamaricis]|uniref:Acyl-CoA synthetase n=1 Tax=Pseudoroseicyclus tamaricis TaxID=2705421 RepID=A0A6B2JWQ9_9RHOB|nr:acyl-CoA synthetase [Pseudoroseicyclus tamaricis]NDU99801.1 acyl-CoA synthetase [Pseudoroseicyclus tamaricis]
MTFATIEDIQSITAEQDWEARDLPKTMWGMIGRVADRCPDRPATTFQMFADPGAREETLTWAELKGQTAQAANMFRRLGIGEDDVVAYLMPNCTEVITTYLGGQVAGIVSPINPLLDPSQIAALLRETGAKVLVTLKSFPKSDVAQKAAEAVRHAPNVKTVLEVDLLRYISGIKKLIVPFIRPKGEVHHSARVLDFHHELARESRSLTFPDAKGDRVAVYFHTGGTTGMPKIARQRYSGIVYNCWIGDRLIFKPTDVILCPLPMFHVFAAIVALGSAIGSGARIVFPTPAGFRGDGVYDNFWKMIERHKVTFVIGVPTAFSRLMQVPVNADISSLRLAFSGSAPLPGELYKRFEKAAGVTICEGYGLTEATCLVSINPPEGEKRIGSIGLPFPHCDVKIFDVDSGEETAVGDVGEICVDNPGVWRGNTYMDETKNVDLYRAGPTSEAQYLRTGDLGRIDEQGYVWITGRAKDLIIRGGHNIDPAEIEEALASHPAVAMAGAIGQPDAHSGEVACAYVELVDGAEVTVEELLAHTTARVHERAAYPKHLEILDELPKTAVGKIFKPDLRKRAITRVYNEALARADVAAEVVAVTEDRRRGLVARLRPTGTATDEDVDRALGGFTRPWDWAAAPEEGASA